jgi:phage tail-like protein
MSPTRNTDPLLAFTFGLEVQGIITGYFTEVSGVSSENEVVEHKVTDPSTHREHVQKVPGRIKWTDITLKRGVTNIMDIWDWRQMVVDGDMNKARKNGSIILYDRSYSEIARWDFTNGWPSKVTGPTFKADSNDFAVEELTIVHEGLVRKS